MVIFLNHSGLRTLAPTAAPLLTGVTHYCALDLSSCWSTPASTYFGSVAYYLSGSICSYLLPYPWLFIEGLNMTLGRKIIVIRAADPWRQLLYCIVLYCIVLYHAKCNTLFNIFVSCSKLIVIITIRFPFFKEDMAKMVSAQKDTR